jgi:putative hemolysin
MVLFGLIDIVVVLFLIILNGVFAMTEFALISARKVRLQQLAEEGDAGAGIALELTANPQQFLSAVQIGITLVGVLSGAFGGARIAGRLGGVFASIPYVGRYGDTLALTLVVGLITYFSLIAELVPKRLALNSPERFASALSAPMRALSRLASPAIHLLGVSTALVLRLLGAKPPAGPPVTEEEIKVFLAQATVAGVFHEAEQTMVERVFRLGDRRVGVMMTPRKKIVWLDANEASDKVVRKIAGSSYSRFPVCQGRLRNVLGVAHVRDMAMQCLGGKPLDLRSAVQKPLVFHENLHALKALDRFRETGMQMALVVDEYGTIEGLVTVTDIVEAVIGDIASAEDIEEPRVVQREDGSWLVDGMLPADEFKALFKIRKLPSERAGGFHTLGGFVMSYMDRVPTAGDSFECCGHRFEVVDMDGRRVDKVLVSALAEPGQSGGE